MRIKKTEVFVIIAVFLLVFVAYRYTSSWNLAVAVYDSKSLNVDTNESATTGVFFKSDGTKMYIIGSAGDAVDQYSLGTAWDVSTGTYDNVTFSVATQTGVPTALFIKPDGTKLYIINNTNTAYQYTIASAWDLSNVTYDNVSFNLNPPVYIARGLFFSSDGTKMYVAHSEADWDVSVYQYALSTAWNLSTASYANKSYTTALNDIQTLALSSDGTKLYLIDNASRKVNEFSLGTAWDVSTATSEGINFSLSSQISAGGYGLAFKSDGTKMYVVANCSGAPQCTVFQYSLTSDSTAPTISSLSPADNAINVSTTPTLVITFDEDVAAGTESVILYDANNNIVEYFTVSSSELVSIAGSVVTISPSVTLDEVSNYYIKMAARTFDDLAGNTFAGITDSTTWNFTTGDFTAPTLSALSPADNAIDVAIADNLVLTFDESVASGSGNIVIYKSADNSVTESIDIQSSAVTVSSAELSVNPTSNLSYSTDYYVLVDSGAIVDTSGNDNAYTGIVSSASWNFTTESQPISNEQPDGSGVHGVPVFDPVPAKQEYIVHKPKGEDGPHYEIVGKDGEVIEFDEESPKEVVEEVLSHPIAPGKEVEPRQSDVTTDHIYLIDFLIGSHNLSRNSVDPMVYVLQHFLNHCGYPLTDSGYGSSGAETQYFGPLTQSALARYQKAHGIYPAIGYFGPITRSKLVCDH